VKDADDEDVLGGDVDDDVSALGVEAHRRREILAQSRETRIGGEQREGPKQSFLIALCLCRSKCRSPWR